MIDLKPFLDTEDYVVLRLSSKYEDGGDIDILCRDRTKFLTHVRIVGESLGRYILIGESNGHLHIDFNTKGGELEFRFDVIEELAYSKVSVDAQFAGVVLSHKKKVQYNGMDIYIPILAHDLAIRFFESVEHPEKKQHYEYIKTHYSHKFLDVVNCFSNLTVFCEGEHLRFTECDETKERLDYFIIWGHGLPYIHEILDTIRENFEILYLEKRAIGDIDEFIRSIYSSDAVPIRHLIDKTRYLLKTRPVIFFVVVKNYNAQEKYFGRGAFRHIQCKLVKGVKEEIRNRFNPKTEGKRTEQHVIHGSDYESQVKHVLMVLGLPPIKYYVRQVSSDFDLPYYLDTIDNYKIETVPINNIRVSILGVGLVPITQTPHYKYLIGDKQSYIEYVKSNLGGKLLVDYSPQRFDLLIENFCYDKRNFILVKEFDYKYRVIDGAHRAAILKHKNTECIKVILPKEELAWT